MSVSTEIMITDPAELKRVERLLRDVMRADEPYSIKRVAAKPSFDEDTGQYFLDITVYIEASESQLKNGVFYDVINAASAALNSLDLQLPSPHVRAKVA